VTFTKTHHDAAEIMRWADDAEYVVGALSGDLSAERLGTDTAEIDWDFGTAGQAKLNLIDDSIEVGRLKTSDTPADGECIVYEATGDEVAFSTCGGGVTDHGALTGLSDDDHTQYGLLAGRAGGQTLNGGTATSDIFNLYSSATASAARIATVENTFSLYPNASDTDVGFIMTNSGTGEGFPRFELGDDTGGGHFRILDDAGDIVMIRENGFASFVGPIGIGATPGTLSTQSCVDVDTDRLYGDVDCDGTKDGGEEYLDEASGGTPDIDSVTGQTSWDSAATKKTADLTIDGVEVDFEAGAAEGYPRLAQSTTPPSGDCDASGEAGRLYFDSDADTDGSVYICRGAAGWKDIDDDGAGGGSIILDLGDDGGNDSTALAEIATENDDYAAIEEESADKAMVDFRQIPPYDNYDPMRPPAAANCATCDEFYDDTASLTWTCNGGTITQTIEKDRYKISKAMSSITQDIAACTVAAPSGSWTATTYTSPFLPTYFSQCGLIAIRTGTQATPTAITECVLFQNGSSGVDTRSALKTATSYTAGDATVGTARQYSFISSPTWQQLRYDAAADTLSCYLSEDGISWRSGSTTTGTNYSPSTNTGVTADPPYVGFLTDDAANTTSIDMSCEFEFLRVRTDANRNNASD
jgi:hypothetical protein